MGVDGGGWGEWGGLVKKQKKYLVSVQLHLSMKHNNKERNKKNLNRNEQKKSGWGGWIGWGGWGGWGWLGWMGWMGWFGEKVEKVLGKCIATSFNET